MLRTEGHNINLIILYNILYYAILPHYPQMIGFECGSQDRQYPWLQSCNSCSTYQVGFHHEFDEIKPTLDLCKTAVMSSDNKDDEILDEEEASSFKEVWHQVAGHKGHGDAPGIPYTLI
jgi:hypothetical protein